MFLCIPSSLFYVKIILCRDSTDFYIIIFKILCGSHFIGISIKLTAMLVGLLHLFLSVIFLIDYSVQTFTTAGAVSYLDPANSSLELSYARYCCSFARQVSLLVFFFKADFLAAGFLEAAAAFSCACPFQGNHYQWWHHYHYQIGQCDSCRR